MIIDDSAHDPSLREGKESIENTAWTTKTEEYLLPKFGICSFYLLFHTIEI